MTTARAARVRWLINPAYSSATAAIRVTRNLATSSAGTVGRSQNTTPASPLPSTTDDRKRATRQPVQLGDQQNSLARAAGRQRGGELRPIGALAALYLPKLCHQLAAGLDDVCGYGVALRLKSKAGSPFGCRTRRGNS